jgi:hypothetical protein
MSKSKLPKGVTIQMKNWSKYQHSKTTKGKALKYFRLQSDFLEDPKLYGLCASMKLTYVYLLTRLCRDNTGVTHICYRHATDMTRLRTKLIHSCVIELERLQLLSIVFDEKNPSREEVGEVGRRGEVEGIYVEKSFDLPTPKAVELKLSPSWVADLWQEKLADKLHALRVPLTPARAKKLRDRIKIFSEKKDWVEAFDKIQNSDFCLGKNDRQWKASFDWILQPDTLTKILEGKYDNKDSKEKNLWGDLFKESEVEL